jgi:hypothetical protein
MFKTFNNSAKISKVKEPTFQITRANYRSSRSSMQENVEANMLLLDLSRIYLELENIDVSILDQITLFTGIKQDIDEDVNLNDGLSYSVDGVRFKADGLDIEDLELDVIDKVSGRLVRLFNKVQRLEMDS